MMEIENKDVIEDTPAVEESTGTEKVTPEVKAVETTTTEETKPIKYFKSFETEESWKEYSKILEQRFTESALKDFGVGSMKELKTLIDSYKTQTETLTQELNQIRQEKALINISSEFKEDALAIAMLKCSKDDKLTLDAAVEQVLEKNPSWGIGTKPNKLGTAKTSDSHQGTQSKVMEAFLNRNPNIKKQFENQ